MKRKRILICAVLLALLANPAMAFEGLKKGDRNNEVQALQLRLGVLGYSVGKVDADYGGKTVKAVEAFQKDRGLDVTGAVDEATWQALYDEKLVITNGDCSAEIGLIPPFARLALSPDDGQKAIYYLNDVQCTADILLIDGSFLDQFDPMREYYRDSVFGDAEKQYQASNYHEDAETFDVNGHAAMSIVTDFDFVNGSRLKYHSLFGAVELGESNGQTAVLRAYTDFSLNPNEESILTADSVRMLLETVRPTGALASAAASAGTAAGASEADAAIVGDWYGIQNDELVIITFNADHTYRVVFETGPDAAGVWAASDGGYIMDETLRIEISGEELRILFSGGDQVFTREKLLSPNIVIPKTGLTEADYLGEWQIADVSLDGLNGTYEDIADDLFGENMTITVYDGYLSARSDERDETEYDVSFNDGELAVSGDGLLNGFRLVVPEDGDALMYIPRAIACHISKVQDARQTDAGAEAAEETAETQGDADAAILGEWYGTQSGGKVVLIFNEDHTYRGVYESDSDSAGVWAATDDGYQMDGRLRVELEGGELHIFTGDEPQIFIREEVQAPDAVAVKAGAAEADYLGEWRPVAFSFEESADEIIEDPIMSEMFGKDIVVSVQPGKASVDSPDWDWSPEEYTTAFVDGKLSLDGDGQFAGGWIAIGEDDRLMGYMPYMGTFILEKIG